MWVKAKLLLVFSSFLSWESLPCFVLSPVYRVHCVNSKLFSWAHAGTWTWRDWQQEVNSLCLLRHFFLLVDYDLHVTFFFPNAFYECSIYKFTKVCLRECWVLNVCHTLENCPCAYIRVQILCKLCAKFRMIFLSTWYVPMTCIKGFRNFYCGPPGLGCTQILNQCRVTHRIVPFDSQLLF